MYEIEDGFEMIKVERKKRIRIFKSNPEVNRVNYKNIITYIYALLHPETKEVRYVGKTIDLKARYANHCSNNAKRHVCNWIKSLFPLKPEMILLEEVYKNWIEAERFWIEYINFIGANLTNVSIGGDGLLGYKHKPETIAKLKNKEVTEETRAKMKESWKTRPPVSAETRAKMSESGKGNQRRKNILHATESKKKMSEKRKLENLSKETRSNKSQGQSNRISKLKPYSNNKARVKGISETQSGSFTTKLWLNGKAYKIGTFETLEEAILKQEKARVVYEA